MKYAIVIPDGAADEPQEALGGRTPLQAARTPAMSRLAAAGVVGRADFVPAALPPGSDVANLNLLGYDARQHYTGRAPLEAAAQGIELGPDDWAVRCNLVTIEDQQMRDFTAGHISGPEAAALMHTLQEQLGAEGVEFHAGVSYRNLLVVRATRHAVPFSADTSTTPPHDLTDQSVLDAYPRGPGSEWLVELMSRSMELFADHPVNVARRREGKLPATNIWLWGLGRKPNLEPFERRYGLRGAMITAVDLLRGLAALIGWQRIDVAGATGYTDTDYAAKGRRAVEALEKVDLICVHVEAPDEAAHEGDVAAKVEALEAIDRHIVGPLSEALAWRGQYRMLVTPDHPTPLRIKTHAHGWVPFVAAGTEIAADSARSYDELAAAQSALVFEEGWRLMGWFLGKPGAPRA